MGFRYRRRIAFGPFRLNLSRSGGSVSVKAGPVTVNPKRNSVYVNLPGGSYYQGQLRRHRSAANPGRAHVTVPSAVWESRIGEPVGQLENRDDVLWSQAPLPHRFHRCKPWTTGATTGLHHVDRCACGAIRLGGWGHPWLDKNSRRKGR